MRRPLAALSLAALALLAPVLPAAVRAQEEPQKVLESTSTGLNLAAIEAKVAQGDAAAAAGKLAQAKTDYDQARLGAQNLARFYRNLSGSFRGLDARIPREMDDKGRQALELQAGIDLRLAAVLRHASLFAGQDVGVVVCGGNIDRRMLSTVLLRSLKRDGKVAKLRIFIQDVPGVLARVTQMVGAAGADIIDIEHQRLFTGLGPRQAELHIVMETRGTAHVEQIVASLQGAGFPAQVL